MLKHVNTHTVRLFKYTYTHNKKWEKEAESFAKTKTGYIVEKRGSSCIGNTVNSGKRKHLHACNRLSLINSFTGHREKDVTPTTANISFYCFVLTSSFSSFFQCFCLIYSPFSVFSPRFSPFSVFLSPFLLFQCFHLLFKYFTSFFSFFSAFTFSFFSYFSVFTFFLSFFSVFTSFFFFFFFFSVSTSTFPANYPIRTTVR